MEKLEKVKKGLKCCMANTPDDPFQKCEECPYNEISIAVEDCRAVLSREALAGGFWHGVEPVHYLNH